jgi:hypothetical protein
MSDGNETKELLEKLLQELYAKGIPPAGAIGPKKDSFLEAADGQFLGRITDNPYDSESITNPYGPYGSAYSGTSIFNAYAQYGSQYGTLSLNNPYSQKPPKLMIDGRLLGLVSANPNIPNRIPTESFLYVLKHNIQSLLRGNRPADELSIRAASGDTFIRAADGTFLGSLNPNKFASDSIFNNYGPHGSKYAEHCIFNRFSEYGGRLSNFSPFNPRATTPPKVISGSKELAWLSVSDRFKPRIDPNAVMEWAQQNVRKKF